ncbi:hypothetical protein AA15973_2437 [Komagataeibacter sucrofermentans DSM 15973]|nr:hypothetical protein AA15973_2437 [Komagataeibacter sucrofermentans DSM 15973]
MDMVKQRLRRFVKATPVRASLVREGGLLRGALCHVNAARHARCRFLPLTTRHGLTGRRAGLALLACAAHDVLGSGP